MHLLDGSRSTRAVCSRHAPPLRISGTLAAMLCLVAGEMLRSPMMDSSTSSQSGLFSMAAMPPAPGADESSEKATWIDR